jgi:hypothetical protein
MKIVAFKSILILILIGKWFFKKEPQSFSNCQLLEQFLKEPVFYTGGTSIQGYDTLVIFDGGAYFSNCDLKALKEAAIEIRPMLDAQQRWYQHLNAAAQYNSHFIITAIRNSSDTMRIEFFKKHSNHDGFFEYIPSGDSLKRINYRIGQY